jgi:predicted MFS family arabinose efflux permease
MVYPTLIAAISYAPHPAMPARASRVYRFWRDLGYAVGALASGVVTNLFGFAAAILAVGALTFVSSIVVAALMQDRPR